MDITGNLDVKLRSAGIYVILFAVGGSVWVDCRGYLSDPVGPCRILSGSKLRTDKAGPAGTYQVSKCHESTFLVVVHSKAAPT